MGGWGLGKVASADAIQNAKTPFVSALYSKYPNTTLITCGEAVGLPDGQMGNSEVGHLNLGAGRIVYQELQRINVAVRDGSFAKNEVSLLTTPGLSAVFLLHEKRKRETGIRKRKGSFIKGGINQKSNYGLEGIKL